MTQYMLHGNNWDEKFDAFHRANPHVYDLFVKLAKQTRDRDAKVGARNIGERIRWHYAVETRGTKRPKLCNSLWPRYARLLMQRDPSFAGFFETRGAA